MGIDNSLDFYRREHLSPLVEENKRKTCTCLEDTFEGIMEGMFIMGVAFLCGTFAFKAINQFSSNPKEKKESILISQSNIENYQEKNKNLNKPQKVIKIGLGRPNKSDYILSSISVPKIENTKYFNEHSHCAYQFNSDGKTLKEIICQDTYKAYY